MFKGTRQNGRSPGSKNKSNIKVREAFEQLVLGNLEQIKKDLKQLEPKDRIKSITDLAKFVLPTLRSTDLVIDNESAFTPIEIIKIKEQ